MIRATAVVFSAQVFPALQKPPLHAQQADGPRFATATIKLNASGDSGGGCCRIQADGHVTAGNVTLRQLIQSAYQRHAFDERAISGAPPWADTARFDVAAKAREVPAF